MPWALLSNRLLRTRVQRNDHLRIALLISLGVHAAVLAIRLHSPPAPTTPKRPLEVALVNTRTEIAPLEPHVLAQADLLGGGDQPDGMSATPLPRTALESPDEVVLAELRKRQAQLEEEQRQLLTRMESAQTVAQFRSEHDAFADAHEAGADMQDQDSLILNARIAALKERIAIYDAMPRQRFVGPSARSDAYAHYLESWRTRIEQLGTEHYPAQARGRVYGSLQLTVYINRDGTLARVEIDRPSEHTVLNQAAQRIVQLAAPFAPLPPEISQETDILAITRTWHFQNRELQTRIP